MKLKTDAGLQLELGPFSRDNCLAFVEGMQKFSTLRYLSMLEGAQTDETEQAWYDGVIKEQNSLIWGIWVIENNQRTLVGNIALREVAPGRTSQASNGIVVTDDAYWGKGIASAAHKALVFYAFRQYGLVRIKSAVMQPNVGSWRAMEKCGYTLVYTERNQRLLNGQSIHMDNLECLNPDDWAWRLWWGNDRPSRKSVEARVRTMGVLEWAEKNVELL
jgi:RimJ/RimL family protein N-acetyltransferase